MKRTIIGGMFGLELPLLIVESEAPFLKNRNLFLVNARSTLLVLIDMLSPSQIWIPSYLCDSILMSLKGKNVPVNFYEVNDRLEVASKTWLEEVSERALVLFISYFGFPFDRESAIQARRRGAFIVEDASQALLSKGAGESADFVLYSPRKFLSVPDGGILATNGQLDIQQTQLQKPPVEWWLKSLEALILRGEFDRGGNNRDWFNLFQASEAESPIGYFAMSEFAEKLLFYAQDYPFICKQRRENYQTLADRIGAIALFPDLPVGVVPLGFPIRIPDRDRIVKVLYHHEIYPAIHWPLDAIVPPQYRSSHQLASEITTLPCDQRYDADDMIRMAELILKEIPS